MKKQDKQFVEAQSGSYGIILFDSNTSSGSKDGSVDSQKLQGPEFIGFESSSDIQKSGYTKVDRRGTIMLTFRPAIGERKYDSEKKQLFALSVTEIGSFISLGPGDSCEFYHDPSVMSRDAGQVRKSLSIKPHTDGYFVSLNVTNNILKTNERFTVPVTTAEFAVMRAAFSFALPHIMGWAQSTNPQADSFGKDVLKVHPRLSAASEWDR